MTVALPERTFQIWSDGWTTVAGEYRIEAARSIGDIRLVASVTIG